MRRLLIVIHYTKKVHKELHYTFRNRLHDNAECMLVLSWLSLAQTIQIAENEGSFQSASSCGPSSECMIDVLFVSIFRASNAFSAFMTNLNSLELISLRSIKNGKISLFGNKELCFIEGTDFTQLLTVQKNQDQGFKIKDYVQSRDNRPPEDCSM